MKKSLFLLFCFIFSTNLFSQIDTNYNFLPPNKVFLSIIEESYGNYVIVGYVSDSLIENSFGYITIINSYGNIENQFLFGTNEEKVIFRKIIKINNNRFLFGSFNENSQRKLFYLKFDYEWNELSRKTITIPSDRNIAAYYPIIDSDSNLVIFGITTDIVNNFPNNFYVKYSLDGDSIISIFNNSAFHPISYFIQESLDKNKYYNLIANYHSNVFSGILQMNKNFDTIIYREFSRELFYTYGSLPYKDSLLIIVGINIDNNHYLEVCVSNENGYISKTLSFKKALTMKEHPALIQCISEMNNNIYIGATSNFDLLNSYYSQNDSWYHLIKFDDTLNVIWEKWYGGDAYYFLNSVLATSDGGCLMVGTKYPHGLSALTRVAHFIKVDANGNVQWTQDIETHDISFNLYPNPTSSFFTIENKDFTIEKIELFDLSGKIISVIDNCENANIQINLESFSNGIYFAKIKSSKGITTQKVVKQ